MLVGAAIFMLLAALMLTITSEAGRVWQQNEAKKKRRAAARIVLETISRDLEGAALPVGTQVPGSLAFLVNPPTVGDDYLSPDAAFWQTRAQADPMGMADIGYFVRWVGTTGQLCRLRIPSSHASSIFRDMSRTLNAALFDALAPGTGDTDFRGLLAENVVGFWFTLIDRDGNAIPPPYDSRSSTSKPAFADVGVALMDDTTAARIKSPSEIRSKYASATVQQFEEALPMHLRQGTQVFTARIPIHAQP